ncbi:glycosyltransferase family 4 protein [Salegentibacter sediminis]|uniref:glycosyltransferase family 4 protein n=1 Tax=Salegentibacter sediminis TaxID=1930251 RepID=UPI0009C0A812|nr:glycosyltransferase family 4 protein [Salegentibacter sediminis]
MKILILINSFGRGGAEKSTASFIIKLKEKYPELEFVCAYLYLYNPGFYDELREHEIPLIHIEESNFIARVWRFKKLIKKHRPQIIHSVLYESNIIGRFSSIGSKVKYVESLVNKTYSMDRDYESKIIKAKTKIIRMLDRITSYAVDYFHSVGYSVADHYKEVYGRDFNCKVVERGRPLPKIEKRSNTIKDDKLILLTLARQEYQKGLSYLLEATLMNRDKVKLKIVGRKGSATKDLVKFIKKHELEELVEFCGYLNDINPVVKEADIYVSASLYEGLPGSVIEAMSLAKPLLLSDIGEHREVAQENINAMFFKPKNILELSEKINFYYENKNLINKYGEKSFEIYLNKFTEDAMTEGMADFYFNLMPNVESQN